MSRVNAQCPQRQRELEACNAGTDGQAHAGSRHGAAARMAAKARAGFTIGSMDATAATQVVAEKIAQQSGGAVHIEKRGPAAKTYLFMHNGTCYFRFARA